MAMPNFTAERSLYQASGHYRGTASFGCAEGTVQLAVKDPSCTARCESSCGCRNLTGILNINRCLQNCYGPCVARCPDLPPPPPPPPPPTTPANIWTGEDCVSYTYVKLCSDPESRQCSFSKECIRQANCTHYDGHCTGTPFWAQYPWLWPPTPTKCVSSSSRTHCVTQWQRFPWIVECDDGSVQQGESYC